MKKSLYLLLLPLLYAGCSTDSRSAATCRALGYKGVVSENSYNIPQYCSNGELVNDKFLTDEGPIAQTYHVRGTKYVREYIEFKENK